MEEQIDCREFRVCLEPLLADEVTAQERRGLRAHADACADCTAHFEFEAGMRSAVARRLRRVAAPPGLEARIRTSLQALTPARAAAAWYRRPGVAALAASVLLAALIVAGSAPPRHAAGPGASLLVSGQRVTIVDRDCERAGRSVSEQRKCRNHQHLNMLKVAGGNYWFVSLDQDDGQRILFDPDLRGRQLLVAGELYPAIRTLRLSDFQPIGGDAGLAPDSVSL